MVMWKWWILWVEIAAKTDTSLRWASYLWLDYSFFLTPLSQWVFWARAPLRKSKQLYLEDATSINWKLLVQKKINGKTVTWYGRPFIKPLLTRIRVNYYPKFTSRSLMQLGCKNTKRSETDKCIVEEGWSFSQIMYFITGKCKLNKRHFYQIPDCDTMFWVRNICFGNFRNNLISSGAFTLSF